MLQDKYKGSSFRERQSMRIKLIIKMLNIIIFYQQDLIHDNFNRAINSMEVPENADQSFQAPIPNKELKQIKRLVFALIILCVFMIILIKKEKTTCEIVINHEQIQPSAKTMQPIYSSAKQIKKEVTQYYVLNSNDQWTAFPELNADILVQQPTKYFIQYNIQNAQPMQGAIPPGMTVLVTRLLIDEKELTQFRVVTADTRHHFNQGSSIIPLNAGIHHIKVQYRTNSQVGVRAHDPHDWHVAVLYITEIQSINSINILKNALQLCKIQSNFNFNL